MADENMGTSNHSFRALCSSLEESGSRYCVISLFGAPQATAEVHVAVHPEDTRKFRSAISILSQSNIRPVQLIQDGPSSFEMRFACLGDAIPQFMAVHVLSGEILPGCSAESIINGRHWNGAFWCANKASEARYLLATVSTKDSTAPHYAQRISIVAAQLGEEKMRCISRQIFGPDWRDEISDALTAGSFELILCTLRDHVRRLCFCRNPVKATWQLLRRDFDCVLRKLRPEGSFIVVLGPDGVGKTTAIRKLREVLGEFFGSCMVMHWRPRILNSRDTDASAIGEPHRCPPRRALASIVHLLYFVADYWLGYLRSEHHILSNSGVIICDRYFHDVLVDPVRYRYGGPIVVARWLSHLVPPRDISFLIFDADPDVILSRKQELPADAIPRLCENYCRLAQTLPNASVVYAGASRDTTAANVCRAAAELLAARFNRRHGDIFNGYPETLPHTERATVVSR